MRRWCKTCPFPWRCRPKRICVRRYGGRAAVTIAPSDRLAITPRVVYRKVEMDGWNRIDEFNILANPFTTTRPAVTLGDRKQFTQLEEVLLSETAYYADVVLAGSLQEEEEEGIVCTSEGRVVHIRQAVTPPAGARNDWAIYRDLAQRLGKGRFFPYRSPREIFDELREASRGGIADYYGITYEKIDRQLGVFWPCPCEDHPGTPRLFEGGVFYHSDGRARFVVAEYRPSGDPVDEKFPTYLTTG